jgi:hypothetical protein
MANIRTLKLNLLADTGNFSKGIKQASGQSESFAKKLGKNFALAGAAIGGAAIALGVDAVRAAAADQKSQKQLALALRNTTKATQAQIKASEKWITKQQFAYGVSDSKLRPALAKLVRVTGDVTKGQDLLSLALDVSAGTGKDLETVTNSLVRAQNGSLGALKKLGVPLSETIVKNKDLAAALKITENSFKGAAKEGAETFNGKLSIFRERVDEAKESIGNALLNAIIPLADKWLPKISEGVTNFVAGLTGEEGITGAAKKGEDAIYNLGEKTRKFLKLLADNKDGLAKTAAIMAGIFIGAKAGTMAQGIVTAVKSIITVMRALTGAAALAAGAEAAATGGTSFYAALPAIGAIAGAFGVAALMGLSGLKPAEIPKALDSGTTFGPNNEPLLVPGGSYDYRPAPSNFKRSNFRNNGNSTVINLNGIVDSESARRSIESLLQTSSLRTGAVNLNRVAI